jgi:hypothetical protein
VAGVVNIVMKNAPERLLVQANMLTGYNMFCAKNTYQSFNAKDINKQSPYELNGSGYYAKPSDFPKTNLDPYTVNLPIDYQANVTIGNRFFDKKAGIIIATNYSNFHQGKVNTIFGYNTTNEGMTCLF